MVYPQNIVTNEELAAAAFSAQSLVFDKLYAQDEMILYKRKRVREHMEPYLLPGSRILELNAGTGEDAVYFSGKGHQVHATDIAAGMLQELANKAQNVNGKISYEQCSYLSLTGLSDKGPYDHIFSNFAGLNCTGELDKVLLSFEALLKPGGTVTLVILPRFCLWETLLLLKGKFRTAFRRPFTRMGAKAFVEGHAFRCWYYNPSYIRNCLRGSFGVLKTEGLCTLVPPAYMEGFSTKYPRLFKILCQGEEKYKTSWPWRSIGDYYIISLRKK